MILALAVRSTRIFTGDRERKAVTVRTSSVRAIAASKLTGLPRDIFEVNEISKEFEGSHPK
jgi:hypothetical protein